MKVLRANNNNKSSLIRFWKLFQPRPSLIYKMLSDFEVKASKFKTGDLVRHASSALRAFCNEDTLYAAVRPLFIVGRLMGLVPLQGVFKAATTSEDLRFNPRSGATWYTRFALSLMLFGFIINTVVSQKGTNLNPADLAWSINLSVFYGVALFAYWYMLTHAERFLQLFRRWRELFIFYDGTDTLLQRDVNLLTFITLTSCILEHSYAHIKFFPIVENAEKRLDARPQLLQRLKNASAWETYYWRSHPFVGDIIPYHVTSAALVFISTKYAIIAWNFGDILASVISRVLSGRFKVLYDEATKELLKGGSGPASRDPDKWRQVARDHEVLCEFVSEMDSCLSPLIFVQFGVNIYYFCLQLNLGLTPSGNTSMIATVYAVWSFLHLIARILIVAVTASQIHVYAHKITTLLKKCPMEAFSAEVERADRNIRTSVIGLTGLGCFTITRTFILQIINVVFTFEIVLLQTGAAPTCTSNSN